MEIPCPSCAKLTEASPCPRCGCELTVLFEIRHAAESFLAEAAQSLREGESADALEHAIQSWTLRHSVEAARSAFLACVALQDFPAALTWRGRAAGG